MGIEFERGRQNKCVYVCLFLNSWYSDGANQHIIEAGGAAGGSRACLVIDDCL